MAWNNAPLFDANAPQVLGYTEEAEEKIVSLALGQNHSLALSSEGIVYSCGANQLG